MKKIPATRYYQYTFENRCAEKYSRRLGEGCCCIFLSTCGENTADVPAELVKFLSYVRADLQESQRDFQDGFVSRLQESIRRIKQSRAMEERFMTLEELLKDERKAGEAAGRAEGELFGLAQGVLELLGEKGRVPEALKEKILAEKEPEILKRWLKQASAAESTEQFEKEI